MAGRRGGIGHTGSPRRGTGSPSNTGTYNPVPPSQQQMTREVSGIPIGFVGPYVGSISPEGWLLCDGALYEEADYPELAAVHPGTMIRPTDNPTSFFGFGSKVIAGQGDTLVIGDHLQTAAYVFVRSGSYWVLQQKLTGSDAVSGDAFGSAVSISGSTVAVGALNHSSGRGAVYVFTRSGTVWTQQQKITTSDPQVNGWFGVDVSLSGNSLVGGAYGVDSAAGAAYVFTRSGSVWTQQQKIVAADAAANDELGRKVSLDSNTLVVGARRESPGGVSTAGSAYVFTRSGSVWTQQQKIVASDPVVGAQFGHEVSVSGDTLVVGAWNFPPNASGVYVFTRSGSVWTQQQKIFTSSGLLLDLSFSGGKIVARDGLGYHVFSMSGGAWVETKLIAPGAGETLQAGGLALFGDYVLFRGFYFGVPVVFVRRWDSKFPTPDYRGRSPLGVSALAGTADIPTQAGGKLDHLHLVDPPNTTSGPPSATVAALAVGGTAAAPTATHDVDIPAFNSGTANGPYLTSNFIIKAF